MNALMQNSDGSNNITPIDQTAYLLTNPFFSGILQLLRYLFGPEYLNLILSNDYINFNENIAKAHLNELPENASSDRVVTCGMLYRRDAIQNTILSILTNPKNRLSLGAPTIIPYTTDPSNTQDPLDELSLLLMGYTMDPSTNQYVLPTIPSNILVSKPFGMQQGSIFNVVNSGSNIANGTDIPSDTDISFGTIHLPPGVYSIHANIPVNISTGTVISKYLTVITSNNSPGSGTITSLATETISSSTRKYIQQMKNVTLTTNTTYNVFVNFSYTSGSITASTVGLKIEAVKIA